MCECISELEKLAKEELTKKSKGDIIGTVEFVESGFVFGDKPRFSTYNTIRYRLSKMRKNGTYSRSILKTVSAHHNYCPFCGEKKEV